MISQFLKQKFEEIIEIYDLNWKTVEEVVSSDSNVLRPIKGVAFEEYLVKIIKANFPRAIIEDGEGDSDVDLIINGKLLQLKTPDKNSTKSLKKVGAALHKTHGDETRPGNLYSRYNNTFDFLVILHPVSGIYIIPYSEIPTHKTYENYLADPAVFDWDSTWLNRWDLLGLGNEKHIDERKIPVSSQLPFLSSETYLEDFEIVEMLCKPQYFRAAVMGLKGNIKEHWLINHLENLKYGIKRPEESYSKYDVSVQNYSGNYLRVQIKGTSKNMCNLNAKTIGFELMGTHGQFPHRGYKMSDLDYVALIISEKQLPVEFNLSKGLHFIFIPIKDCPLHYFIGNGINGKEKGTQNEKWNNIVYNDVLYPNIKLKFEQIGDKILFYPNLTSYKSSKGFDTIPQNSNFRNAGPYVLDEIPTELKIQNQ